jgi:hypothetical protein
MSNISVTSSAWIFLSFFKTTYEKDKLYNKRRKKDNHSYKQSTDNFESKTAFIKKDGYLISKSPEQH